MCFKKGPFSNLQHKHPGKDHRSRPRGTTSHILGRIRNVSKSAFTKIKAYIPLQRESACVWGFTLGLTPNASLLRCEASLTQREASPTQRNPQCNYINYRLCWVPSSWGLRCPCPFHVVCVNRLCSITLPP